MGKKTRARKHFFSWCNKVVTTYYIDFKDYNTSCNNDVTNLTSVNLKILATVNFAVTLHRQRSTNPLTKQKETNKNINP